TGGGDAGPWPPPRGRLSEQQIADQGADDRHRQAPGEQFVEERAALLRRGSGHAQRADRRERRDVDEMPAAVHRRRNRQRAPPPSLPDASASAPAPGSWAARPGTIGKNAGNTPPDVLL